MDVLKVLNIQHPIIQAPMALADSPVLAAAVSNLGGLGSMGAALFEPDQIRQKIKEIRTLTDKPFNINLFAPTELSKYSEEEINRALHDLNYFRKKLGMSIHDHIDIPSMTSFEEKLAVMLDEKVLNYLMNL